MKGKKRSHELVATDAFLDKVNKLMASDAKSKQPTRKNTARKTAKKATVRKKASTSRRKWPQINGLAVPGMPMGSP